MQDLTKLKIPEGWKLERTNTGANQAYLSTPPGFGYAVTLDFTNRGFRIGIWPSGICVGHEYYNRKERKMYKGRGWAQTLVDDGVAHLRKLL